MTAEIKTRSGKTILFDEQDLHLLVKYSYLIFTPTNRRTSYVALRTRDEFPRRYVGFLHTLIVNPAQGYTVDHSNGNGLDCRRANLKQVTHSENNQNQRRKSNLVKGVYWRTDRKMWVARITINYKVITLGSFILHEQAILARIEAEDKYFTNAGNGTEN